MKQNIIELSSKDLQYIILESVKKILEEKTDLNSLKRYLTMPDKKKKLLNVKLHKQNFINYLYAFRGIEVPNNISYDELIKNYGEYVDEYTEKIESATSAVIGGGHVDAGFQNSNMYLNHKGEKNGWLLHFTDNPYLILKNGFKGLMDQNKIHRTLGYDEFKRGVGKGLGFAHSLDNLSQETYKGKTYFFDTFKRDYVIIFKAPSITVYHKLDGNDQEIFDVSQVDRNNIYIFKINNKNSSIIKEMICCYPLTFKGITVSDPNEAIQTIEQGAYQSIENSSNLEEVNGLVSIFEKAPFVEINDSMEEIKLKYLLCAGDFRFERKPFYDLKAEDSIFPQALVNRFVKNGYALKQQNENEDSEILFNAVLYNKQKNIEITLSAKFNGKVSTCSVTINF